MSDDAGDNPSTRLPHYGRQLLAAVLAAGALALTTVGVAAAALDRTAICSDDSGHGGNSGPGSDNSGHGGGDD